MRDSRDTTMTRGAAIEGVRPSRRRSRRKYPEIVRVEDMLAKTLTMGGAGFGVAQQLLASITGGNKTVPAVEKVDVIV